MNIETWEDFIKAVQEQQLFAERAGKKVAQIFVTGPFYDKLIRLLPLHILPPKPKEIWKVLGIRIIIVNDYFANTVNKWGQI